MKIIILIWLFFPLYKVHSQELKVTYNNRILVDSNSLKNASGNMKNKLLMDAKGEDYELIMRNGISLYEPVVLQGDKKIENSNIDSEIFHNYYETIYNDNNKKERISSIKFSGETFLINERLKPIDWQIMQETKKIDSYHVQRAEAIVDGKNVIVWFTDEIPVSSGPSYFMGLPGLILQAQFGKRLITAKKVEPLTRDIILLPPLKGKAYSRKEYDELVNFANQEEGTKRKGNTTTTVIHH